jgi:hypothetical protein
MKTTTMIPLLAFRSPPAPAATAAEPKQAGLRPSQSSPPRPRHHGLASVVAVLTSSLLFLLCSSHVVSAKSPSFLPKTKRQPSPPPAARTTRMVAATRGRIRASEAPWVSGMKNSLASALAAGCSKLILAPFDTIKTLQQHSRSGVAGGSLSLVQAAQAVMGRPRGVLEFYVSVFAVSEDGPTAACNIRDSMRLTLRRAGRLVGDRSLLRTCFLNVLFLSRKNSHNRLSVKTSPYVVNTPCRCRPHRVWYARPLNRPESG